MRAHTRTTFFTVVCVSSMVTSVSASAADLLGLYVGAGVGKSEVRLDRTLANTAYDFNEHHVGWEAMVGIRPLPFLGGEIEYLDFGNPAHDTIVASSHVDTRAEAVFGTLYAPIPAPFFDLYGKLGVAHVKNDAHSEYYGPLPVGFGGAGCCTTSAKRTNTGFAYGAGMQFKFAAAAVRAQYEHFSTSVGDPSMLSVGVTWTF